VPTCAAVKGALDAGTDLERLALWDPWDPPR
jgi:hypothetical protein